MEKIGDQINLLGQIEQTGFGAARDIAGLRGQQAAIGAGLSGQQAGLNAGLFGQQAGLSSSLLGQQAGIGAGFAGQQGVPKNVSIKSTRPRPAGPEIVG